MAGVQQALYAADVDKAGAPAATHDDDEFLVADLGVDFRCGALVGVPFREETTLLALVVGQALQGRARGRQSEDRIAFLAKWPVQSVGDPGPPLRELRADPDVAAPPCPARAGGPRLEVGEPGEVQDVAQLAQGLVAQHGGMVEGEPNQPALHSRQDQIRTGRREFGRVKLRRIEVGSVVGVDRCVLAESAGIDGVRVAVAPKRHRIARSSSASSLGGIVDSLTSTLSAWQHQDRNRADA